VQQVAGKNSAHHYIPEDGNIQLYSPPGWCSADKSTETATTAIRNSKRRHGFETEAPSRAGARTIVFPAPLPLYRVAMQPALLLRTRKLNYLLRRGNCITLRSLLLITLIWSL
jgi:hypothetical protein